MLFSMLGGYEPFFPPTNFVPVEFDDSYWSHVSPECKAFIERLLELDPAKRITSAE